MNVVKENKEDFIKLLNKITKVKIQEVESYNVIGMKDLSDYNFSMSEIKAVTINKQKAKIFIKKIKRNRIKESIFCYWTVLYEEYLKDKQYEEMKKIINKVSIGELERDEEFKKSVLLNIENNTTDFLKKGTTVHLVDIKGYIKKYFDKKEDIHNIEKNVDISDEEILLIGIVLD
ncbi:MAG: hypothetical protein IJV31_12330 [Clostridia bacterium]|nr:hypothetical protein [Clostridia bacterium]